jgi:hypothetical protein
VERALSGTLLRDELWVCGDAMENLFGLGSRYARSFYYPINYKFDKSPQAKRIEWAYGQIRIYFNVGIRIHPVRILTQANRNQSREWQVLLFPCILKCL